MSDYKTLISSKRKTPSTGPPRTLDEEFISDYGRILYSNQFRRLQQKAQVFPLEDNAAVRSRLTHSYEVSHIGGLIAKRITEKLPKYFGKLVYRDSFIKIISTACAIHDIGNPPFGHFGEHAIREWFEKSGYKKWKKFLKTNIPHKEVAKYEKQVDDIYCPDFKNFDGNAQGFRILTKLQWTRDENSYNLTYSQLSAYLKYVRACSDKDDPHRYGKHGYFESEKAIVNEIWTALGLKEGQRNPMTYVMEAADDIAYCLSDIDDGIEKRLIDYDHLRMNLINISKSVFGSEDNILKEKIEKVKNYKDYLFFRVDFTNFLVDFCVDQFVTNHYKILSENYAGKILNGGSDQYKSLETIKQYARKYVFTTIPAENIELGGYAAIWGILEYISVLLEIDVKHFVSAIKKSRFTDEEIETFANNILNGQEKKVDNRIKRIVNKMPAKFIRAYLFSIKDLNWTNSTDKIRELSERTHLLTDYVSCMTDKHALQTYQLLKGIDIG